MNSLTAVLVERGLAMFDGVASKEDLLRLARSIATIVPHRDSDSTGITAIADVGSQVRSGFAGFTTSALNPHTDRSGIDRPPALLLMSCQQPATRGGECVVIDGKSVYDDLASTNPEAIKALSAPRSVLFGGAAGHLGSIFTRVGDRVSVRLRLDDLAKFSSEVARWIPDLRATLGRHIHILRLNAGQGYILDNHRWLHGRRTFSGQRVMYRVNGDPLDSLGVKSGFRASFIPVLSEETSGV
ncbi:TauD/TfdA family dioxygenase [Actinophytocola xanthii]|uniref:TauD/TfdA family dioxygenase n=1 Tax=Actinophytocola xanthii TaxID=1912961 RepID=UPI001300E425|nr:TauD/TfdA family dioxygenase [Actinophytocola xanthii]